MSVQQAADGAGARPFRQNLRQIASFLISRIRSTTNFARNVRARESSNDAKTIGHYVVPIEDTNDEFGAELKAEEQSDDLARKNEVGATCPAMGNLQSDGKKRSKKQNVEEPSVRVTFEKVHTSGKRLAPQPPKFNAPQAQPSVIVSKVDDDDIKISLEHETEDTPAKIASGPKSPLEQSKEGPSVPVPPLGALPVPTMGPPLLVTDSWRRANADLVLPDIPTPPSQQSSSDSVFTDPEDIALMIATNASVTADSEVSITGLKTPKNLPSTPRNRNFTITGRRKIDLNSPPSQYGTPQSLEATPRRRHSTIEQTPSNSTVLRRVSSFTLSNATARDINKKTQRSTDTNSKVSPELREKFEGQHLVNLLVSGIPENLRNQLSDGDLNKFTAALYAQLQAVGVIKPLGDKITTKNNNFPINQLYYRESSKEKLSNEPKNGDTKISIEYVQTLENDIINLQKQVEKLQTTIDKCQNKQKNSNLVAMRSKASSPIQNTSHDSVEAYDKNSFSSESGRFTATSLDISPISYQFAEKSTDTSSSVHPSNLSPICEVEANVHKGLSRPDSLLISAKKNDTDDSDILDHRIYTDENDKNTAIDTSNKINIVNHSSDARRKLDYIHDDEIINDSCGGDSMKNNFFEIIEKNVSSPTEITSINAPPPPPPMPSAFEPSKPPQMPDDVGPPRPPPMPETVEPSPMPSIIAFPSPPPMPDVYEPSQPRPMLDEIRHSRPPPPPPMPGTVEPPQPPPMPGMFGPPQPPSMPGTVEPPPPPPMPGIFGPPQPPPMPGIIGPPPPPPMPGVIGPPPPPPMVGICGSVPPPPPPIPGISGPPPPPISGLIGFPPSMPPPPPGGFNPPARATMRKQPLVPELPMKPLYWTKINIPVNTKPMISLTSPDTPPIIPLWIEIEEEPVNMKEFADLFSRQVVERKPKVVIDEMSKSSKIQPAKILDTKRSKNVGILERSLRVDFSEVENAVYNLDTSIVSLEALRRIYEILPSAKEMEEITAHEKKHPEIPLDRPEMFLKQLSTIKYFNERIATLMFQSEFQDAVSTVSSKLTNLRSTCEYLCNAQSLKRVMALILTLGNYMNGGNFSRGQADGFDLEILGKLKDVKSKIPGVTLLHYVVRVRLEQEGNYNFDELLPLPVPEPADIEAASTIDFQEISDELDKLDRELHVCEEHSNKVLESCPDNSAAFKEKVDLILNRARNDLTNERENLQEARGKFRGVMFFYQYVPKKSTVDMANPKDFFPLWITFCRDFKDIWKKEQQRLRKERMKNIKSKLEVNRKVETTETVPGGFKDILLKRIAKNKK